MNHIDHNDNIVFYFQPEYNYHHLHKLCYMDVIFYISNQLN